MGDNLQQSRTQLATNQPGVVDTSTKRVVTQSQQQFQGPTTTTTVQQPIVTRKITRKLIPMDEQGQEVAYQEPLPQIAMPPPQPAIHPVQQMIWPVAVQFNEDDALTKIREEKILGLLERQSEMLANMLTKYKRIEEEQNYKMKKRIKELERENEEIWQKRRQNYMIYNVAQSVDQRLREFNEFQLKPWMDQGQPILLKPMHQDDREFFDHKRKVVKKKKKKKPQVVDDGLVQDPVTGDLWDPKTGLVVQPGNSSMMSGSQVP